MFGLVLGRKRLLSDPKRLGKWGERRCERFLCGKGYRTLVRNYSCKMGEIDIIMVDGEGTIVFIEVKTRGGEEFGTPARAVDRKKQRQIARVAAHYLQERRLAGVDCRFDVLALMETAESGELEIDHIENAFWIGRTYVV